jgi:hypothetical protein
MQEIGLVAKIEGVTRQRSVAFEGGVIAELNQFPRERIDLRINKDRAKAAQKQKR